MSDLGSVVGIDGENINLNLLSVNDLESILKDVKKREREVKKEIDDILDNKKESSKEITLINFSSENIADAEIAVKGRDGLGDVSGVVKGIESFKLTVMEEIRKRLNTNINERKEKQMKPAVNDKKVEVDKKMEIKNTDTNINNTNMS